MTERIQLVGALPQDAVRDRMLAADLFLLPSVTAASGDTEGLGVVLLEAQLTGLPVVATRHNGFVDAVDDGRSGFLVPERDVEALVERLSYLIDNPQCWDDMGRRGRAYVIGRYGKDRVFGELEQLFQRLLTDSSASPPFPKP